VQVVGQNTGMEVDAVRLRELREERVLSLRELEERSGVSHNTIWRIEDGRQGAHPRTVRKLAEALGVPPSELTVGRRRKDV
jgi:transcriptional regulator with XRE-family HTH domain